MKLPLWVYNYTEKRYKVFPYPHLLETLSDGSTGLKFRCYSDTSCHAKAFLEYRYYFEPNPINWYHGFSLYMYEYRLRRQ